MHTSTLRKKNKHDQVGVTLTLNDGNIYLLDFDNIADCLNFLESENEIIPFVVFLIIEHSTFMIRSDNLESTKSCLFDVFCKKLTNTCVKTNHAC